MQFIPSGNVEGHNVAFPIIARKELVEIVSTGPDEGRPTSATSIYEGRAMRERPWIRRIGRARHGRSSGSRPKDSRYKVWLLEVHTDIWLSLIHVGDMLFTTPNIRNCHRIGTALDGGDSVDVFVDIGDQDSTSIKSRWRMTQCYGKALKVLFNVVDAFI